MPRSQTFTFAGRAWERGKAQRARAAHLGHVSRQSGECWAKLCGVYVTVLLSS